MNAKSILGCVAIGLFAVASMSAQAGGNSYANTVEAQRWQLLAVSACETPSLEAGRIYEGYGMREANRVSQRLVAGNNGLTGCARIKVYPVCNLPQAGAPEPCASKGGNRRVSQ